MSSRKTNMRSKFGTVVRGALRSALCALLLLIPLTAANAQSLLFDPVADPAKLIAEGRAAAAKTGKLLMIEFGADWCGDCQALNRLLNSTAVKAVFDANFVLVRIDIGRFDKNLGLVESYGLPIKKGIPTIAVTDAAGKIVHATKNGEWSNARRMTEAELLSYLKGIKK